MIIVFGSNESGLHAGGAARFAYQHKCAIRGRGEGLQGESYAVPTMDGLDEPKAAIVRLLEYAAAHPDLGFQITRLGCVASLASTMRRSPRSSPSSR